MKTKHSVFIATSLEGYIADKNGGAIGQIQYQIPIFKSARKSSVKD